MIPTSIPKLDKEQTEQLVKDIKKKTSKKDLEFWQNAIKQSKNIKRK
jgi:hypothetical protein